MICFELSRNGKRMATAGRPGFAVLSAIFTWVRRRSRRKPGAAEEELNFSLGGLDSNDELNGYHVQWLNEDAKVGDVFTLRVLERDRVDPPKSRSPRENRRGHIANLEGNIAMHQRALKTLRAMLRKTRRKPAAKTRRGAPDR